MTAGLDETPTATVEAAGGVLWRRSDETTTAASRGRAGPTLDPRDVEVALAHRPKYDDWSLPKGKLDPGEHPLVGALREVWEETGFASLPGTYLTEIRYVANGLPKRVRYWSLHATDGSFRANHEVDQLEWLPVAQARERLQAEHDRPVLDAFARDVTDTRPFLIIRHGSAGDRKRWTGPDSMRPLDELGRTQAGALAPVLSAYGVRRLVSAPVLRCMQTAAPYAAEHRLPVATTPLVSEAGFGAHPDLACARVLDLMAAGEITALFSQGGVIDAFVSHACARSDLARPSDPSVDKGGAWVLHVAAGGLGRHSAARLTSLERLGPDPR